MTKNIQEALCKYLAEKGHEHICEWIKTQDEYKLKPITDEGSLFYHVSLMSIAKIIYKYKQQNEQEGGYSKQEKYQVGFPNYDVVGKFFEEISKQNKEVDFTIVWRNLQQSNDIIHSLIADNKLFALVYERRTEFNDLEYTFFCLSQSTTPQDKDKEMAIEDESIIWEEVLEKVRNEMILGNNNKEIISISELQSKYSITRKQ